MDLVELGNDEAGNLPCSERVGERLLGPPESGRDPERDLLPREVLGHRARLLDALSGEGRAGWPAGGRAVAVRACGGVAKEKERLHT
jgi:hypothetical protein